MAQNICLDKENFQKMENEILKDVLSTSKSMIETFKFRIICGLNITQPKINKTLSDLNKFRKQNWDSRLGKNKAYKKYLDLY